MTDGSPGKVLYVVGTTRCGSTILGTLLARIPGLVHVGELGQVWEEGFLGNRRCGCGAPFLECEFWRDVVADAFAGTEMVPGHLLAVVRAGARTRHAIRLVTPGGRQRLVAQLVEHTEAMARLYRAIRWRSGAHVVVDSSKSPMLGWSLASHPDIDLHILHVTRDPRAVAYSWRQKKFDPAKGGDMPRESTARTALTWTVWNGLAAALWDYPGASRARYRHLRYEDFAANPRDVVRDLLLWLGQPEQGADVVSVDGRFVAGTSHTVAGNPMRFDRGETRVRPDERWRESSSRWENRLVSSVTWPLLARYGYALRSRRRG